MIVCLLSLSVRRVCCFILLLLVEYANHILVASTTQTHKLKCETDETNCGNTNVFGRFQSWTAGVRCSYHSTITAKGTCIDRKLILKKYWIPLASFSAISATEEISKRFEIR